MLFTCDYLLWFEATSKSTLCIGEELAICYRGHQLRWIFRSVQYFHWVETAPVTCLLLLLIKCISTKSQKDVCWKRCYRQGISTTPPPQKRSLNVLGATHNPYRAENKKGKREEREILDRLANMNMQFTVYRSRHIIYSYPRSNFLWHPSAFQCGLCFNGGSILTPAKVGNGRGPYASWLCITLGYIKCSVLWLFLAWVKLLYMSASERDKVLTKA